MSRLSTSIVLALIVTSLSACQLFQTIESPAPTTQPSAQESIAAALGNFYDLQSGTFVQNYLLTLYQDNTALDKWTVSSRENWRSSPDQSLADIHLTFTLPPPSTNGEIAQGLINLKVATDKADRYIQLNSANFSGKDGHVLDDALAQWSNQWFQVPANILAESGFAWIFSLPDIFKSFDRNTAVTTQYFTVQSAQNVQTDHEQATLYKVTLNPENITALLAKQAPTNPLLATELDSITRFLNASQFTGSLLIGNASHQIQKVEGILVVTSATAPNQTLNLKLDIELLNSNQTPPVAIPTQASPLPTELADPNKVLQ